MCLTLFQLCATLCTGCHHGSLGGGTRAGMLAMVASEPMASGSVASPGLLAMACCDPGTGLTLPHNLINLSLQWLLGIAYGFDQGSLMAAIKDRLWLRSGIAYGCDQGSLMDGRRWTDADGRTRMDDRGWTIADGWTCI